MSTNTITWYPLYEGFADPYDLGIVVDENNVKYNRSWAQAKRDFPGVIKSAVELGS